MSEQVTKVRPNLAPLLSSLRHDWQTPDDILELVRVVFCGAIALDPCTAIDNPTGADRFFTMNGLDHQWRHIANNGGIFVNPPYGRDLGNWIMKCKEEAAFGAEVIALHTARTDTRWFQDSNAHATCFIKGRLKFKGAPAPAPFPSAVSYWGPNKYRFAEVFSKRGIIWL